MCYSAQIWQDYRKYVRQFDGQLDLEAFVQLFWSRLDNDKIKIPKAMEMAFTDPLNPSEEGFKQIRAAVGIWQTQQALKLEQELFKQRARLADAQRALQSKTTKAALEAQRISGSKVEWILAKLADLRRRELQDDDSRIYPGTYAPVMVIEDGRRVLKPMRYQCRPAGKPVSYDRQYPGTYNARRDNLEGFWKRQFGHSHGLMVVNAFYEHVTRPRPTAASTGNGHEGDGLENVILEFRPRPQQDMLVACLWSHWRGEGESDLDSFAAITDTPPEEVAAVGHDRCIIPIKYKNMEAWLSQNPRNLSDLYAILDDRQRPYFEHRLAA
ncbi:SOS response-associated peptidase family protein [Rhodoferax fermentans]|jgi:putative SOS response-associated peptidase YedK|uniref:DUF159 family protein n=1 Tax=Rhodoferax fermentans TaxID=28066 RepID=A0A1T1AMI2_RHOFE|nr:SOS response-associated peptidase family protein [Rhodoferax fermentans]MBK1683934.1 hypothetical protein [Rhodoferax fermentans]OOV05362.1 hypothetical protein RF819_00345 [Rhodoferax fermentans]